VSTEKGTVGAIVGITLLILLIAFGRAHAESAGEAIRADCKMKAYMVKLLTIDRDKGWSEEKELTLIMTSGLPPADQNNLVFTIREIYRPPPLTPTEMYYAVLTGCLQGETASKEKQDAKVGH
jgi:hypothetical protein